MLVNSHILSLVTNLLLCTCAHAYRRISYAHARTHHPHADSLMTAPRDPLTRLALLCHRHSNPQRRALLAEQTLKIAFAVARLMSRRRWIRRCDVSCVAVDAAAWCLGEGRRFFVHGTARWSTFVALTVRREAARIIDDEARQARIRREIARRLGGGDGDSHF